MHMCYSDFIYYRVDISDDDDEYSCKCGNYEHSRLLCGYVLKVSLSNHICELRELVMSCVPDLTNRLIALICR